MTLESLLGEALFAQVQQKLDAVNEAEPDKKKHVRFVDLSEGGYVSRERFEAAIEERNRQLETMQQQTEKKVKTFSLVSEMTKQGVLDPEYLIYKAGGIDAFSFDESGSVQKLEETLEAYRQNETTAHLFREEKGGAYHPKGGESVPPKNPFAKDGFNLSKQGELFKTDPQKARELARAAGVILD